MSSCHTTIGPSLVPCRYVPIFRYALGEFMFADFGEVLGRTSCPSRYTSSKAAPESFENFTCSR